MKFLKWYETVNDYLGKCLLVFAAAMIAMDTIMIFTGVVLRLTDISVSAFEEFPRLMSACITFPAVALFLKSANHISVDFLPTILKGKALARLEALIFFSTAVGSWFMLRSGIESMLVLYSTSQVTVSEIEIPVWYLHINLVVGFVLLFLQSIVLTIGKILQPDATERPRVPHGEFEGFEE
jgi:TRAP-type C4-dicarboxylate transport system permease small subunit